MHVWQAFANPLTLLASLEGSYAPSIEHTRRLKLPIEAAVCRRASIVDAIVPPHNNPVVEEIGMLPAQLLNLPSSSSNQHHIDILLHVKSKLVCAWLAVVTTFVQNARKKKFYQMLTTWK